MQIPYYKNNNSNNLHPVCKFNNFLLFKILQQTTLYNNDFSYRGIRHPQQIEGPCFVEDMSKRSNIRTETFYGSIQIDIPLRLVFYVFNFNNNQCHVNDISIGSNSSRINFIGSNFCIQLSNARFDL